MGEKQQVAVYKIDLEEFADNYNLKKDIADSFIKHIDSNLKKNSYSPLRIKNLNNDIKAYAYHKEVASKDDRWKKFLQNHIESDIKEFLNKWHNVLIFFKLNESIYMMSIGTGSADISDWIDENFPKEVAKRILTPKTLTKINSRSLSGAYYAKELYLRESFNMGGLQNFGSIWKEIIAEIDTNLLKSHKTLPKIFQDMDFTFCDVKKSFLIKKSISFEELLDILLGFEQLLSKDPSNEQKRAFAMLDSVRMLSTKNDRELIEQLENIVLKNAFNFINSKSNEFNFDFVHADYKKYLINNEFGLTGNNKLKDIPKWEHPPSSEEILNRMKTNGCFIKPEDFNSIIDVLDKTRFYSINIEDKKLNTEGSWLSHISGEVDFKDKSYFRIDKKWYLVNKTLIDALASEIELFLKEEMNLTNVIFDDWNNSQDTVEELHKEKKYNVKYCSKNNFIVADCVIVQNYELFDLLTWDKKKLHIIQVKKGLGATMRDACSQIRNSYNVIENDLKESKTLLKALYKKLSTKLPVGYTSSPQENLCNLNEKEFLGLFKKDRQYCVSVALEDVVNIGDYKMKSNIAKFEILTTSYEVRNFKLGLIKII